MNIYFKGTRLLFIDQREKRDISTVEPPALIRSPTGHNDLVVLLESFKLDYEYEIEYKYDFRFSNQ